MNNKSGLLARVPHPADGGRKIFWWALFGFVPIAFLFGLAFFHKELSLWHKLEYWAVVATFYTTCVGFVLFATTYIHTLTAGDRGLSVIALVMTIVLALYSMAVVEQWLLHLILIALIFLLYVLFDWRMATLLERRRCPATTYRMMRRFVDGPTVLAVVAIIIGRALLEQPEGTVSGSVATECDDDLDIFVAGAMAFMLVFSFVAFLFNACLKPIDGATASINDASQGNAVTVTTEEDKAR